MFLALPVPGSMYWRAISSAKSETNISYIPVLRAIYISQDYIAIMT